MFGFPFVFVHKTIVEGVLFVYLFTLLTTTPVWNTPKFLHCWMIHKQEMYAEQLGFIRWAEC